jgi:hypothetical protein
MKRLLIAFALLMAPVAAEAAEQRVRHAGAALVVLRHRGL